ncbi:MAG: hypothetical protein HOP11_03495 [Saprospiraceae bacterium]|nr:hypothetical protein [Saprospiraceae bacterium]
MKTIFLLNHADAIARRLSFSAVIITTTLLLLLSNYFSCQPQEAESLPQTSSTGLNSRSALPVLKLPKLDTTYRPIMWGSQLKPIPGITIKGSNKKFPPYWFTKVYADNLVKPSNYQQDGLNERVAFADSALITNSDTFYICRRVIK